MNDDDSSSSGSSREDSSNHSSLHGTSGPLMGGKRPDWMSKFSLAPMAPATTTTITTNTTIPRPTAAPHSSHDEGTLDPSSSSDSSVSSEDSDDERMLVHQPDWMKQVENVGRKVVGPTLASAGTLTPAPTKTTSTTTTTRNGNATAPMPQHRSAPFAAQSPPWSSHSTKKRVTTVHKDTTIDTTVDRTMISTAHVTPTTTTTTTKPTTSQSAAGGSEWLLKFSQGQKNGGLSDDMTSSSSSSSSSSCPSGQEPESDEESNKEDDPNVKPAWMSRFQQPSLPLPNPLSRSHHRERMKTDAAFEQEQSVGSGDGVQIGTAEKPVVLTHLKQNSTPTWKHDKCLNVEPKQKLGTAHAQKYGTTKTQHLVTEDGSEVRILSHANDRAGNNDTSESIDQQNLPEWMKKFNNMHLKEASVVSAQGRAPQGVSRMRRGSTAMIERSHDIYNPMEEPATSLPREIPESPKKMEHHRFEFGTTDKLEATTNPERTNIPKKLQTVATSDTSSEVIVAKQNDSVSQSSNPKDGDQHKDSTTTPRSHYSEQVEIDNSKVENVLRIWGDTVKAKRPGNATTMTFRMIQNQAEKVRQRIAKAKESIQDDKSDKDKIGEDGDNESIQDVHKGSEPSTSQMDDSAAALFRGERDTRTPMHESDGFDNSAAELFGYSSVCGEKNAPVIRSKPGAPMDMSMDLSAAAVFGFGGDTDKSSENIRSSEIGSMDGGVIARMGVTKGGSKELSMDLSAAAMFGFGAMDGSSENLRSTEIASLESEKIIRTGVANAGSKHQSMDLSAAAMFGFGAMDGSSENLRSIEVDCLDSAMITREGVSEGSKDLSMDLSAAAMFGFGATDRSSGNRRSAEDTGNATVKEGAIKDDDKKSSVVDSDSELVKNFCQERPPSTKVPYPKKRSSLSDSESDDSSDKKPIKVLPFSRRKSFLDDSDSDDSSDDENNKRQAAVKKNSLLNDSESDDSSVDKERMNLVVVKKKSFSTDSTSDERSNDGSPKTQVAKKKQFSNDSESEDSRSDDEKAKTQAAVKTKSFSSDSDDDDSSADQKAMTQAAPKKNLLLDDSDSDDCDSKETRLSRLASNASQPTNMHSERIPPVTVTAISSSIGAPGKTKETANSDHNSSSSDESEESKHPAAISRKPPEDNSSSSSDTDSGSSSSTSSPRPNKSTVLMMSDDRNNSASPSGLVTKKNPVLDASLISSGSSSSSSTSSDTSGRREPKRSSLSEKEKGIRAPTRSVSIINPDSVDTQSKEIPDYENEKSREDAAWQVALEQLAAEEQAKKEKEEQDAWTAALENLSAEELRKPEAEDVWDTAMQDLVEYMKSNDDKLSISDAGKFVPSEKVKELDRVTDKNLARHDNAMKGPAKRMSWEPSLDSSTHTAPPRKPTRQKSAKISLNVPPSETREESTAKQPNAKKSEVIPTPRESTSKDRKSKKYQAVPTSKESTNRKSKKKSDVTAVHSVAAGEDPRIFATAMSPSPFAPVIVSRGKTSTISVDNPFAPLGASSHHTASSLNDPFAPLNASSRSTLFVGDLSASSGRALKNDNWRDYPFSPQSKKLKSPMKLLGKVKSKGSVSPKGIEKSAKKAKKAKKVKKAKKGNDHSFENGSYSDDSFSVDSDESTEESRNYSKVKSKKNKLPPKSSVEPHKDIEPKAQTRKNSTKDELVGKKKDNGKDSKKASKQSRSNSVNRKTDENPTPSRSGPVRRMGKDSKSGRRSRSKSTGRQAKGEDQIEASLERKSSARGRSKSVERKKKGKKDRG